MRHGLEVTVLDKAPQPMSTLDPDMGAMVHEAMEGWGSTSACTPTSRGSRPAATGT